MDIRKILIRLSNLGYSCWIGQDYDKTLQINICCVQIEKRIDIDKWDESQFTSKTIDKCFEQVNQFLDSIDI